MRESVPTARYSPVCNVLRQWKPRSSLLIESTDSMIMVCFDSVHKGEDRDGILSTTGEPESNVADSFDGSGVVAAPLSSTIPHSVIKYWTNLNAKAA